MVSRLKNVTPPAANHPKVSRLIKCWAPAVVTISIYRIYFPFINPFRIFPRFFLSAYPGRVSISRVGRRRRVEARGTKPTCKFKKFKIWPRGAAKFRNLNFAALGLNRRRRRVVSRRVASVVVASRRVGRRRLIIFPKIYFRAWGAKINFAAPALPDIFLWLSFFIRLCFFVDVYMIFHNVYDFLKFLFFLFYKIF